MLAKTKVLIGSLALAIYLALAPVVLAAAADEEAQPRDELRLLDDTPDLESDDLSEGISELEATIAALEEQLRLSEENLDRARLEYQELDSRLAELEEEVALLQSIIAVEDQRLAQLQAELESQVAAGEQALVDNSATNNNANIPGANAGVAASDTAAGSSQEEQSSGNTLLVVGIAVVLGVVLFALLSLTRRRAEANRAARARNFDPVFARDDEPSFGEHGNDEPEPAADPERNKQRSGGFPPPYSAAAAGGAVAAGQGGEEESFAFTLQEKPAESDGIEQVAPATKSSPIQSGAGGTLNYTALENGDLDFDDDNETVSTGNAARSSGIAQDECDTKLDLATAYEAMGDVEDAIDILDEVIAEGSPGQVELAQRLKQSWQATR